MGSGSCGVPGVAARHLPDAVNARRVVPMFILTSSAARIENQAFWLTGAAGAETKTRASLQVTVNSENDVAVCGIEDLPG